MVGVAASSSVPDEKPEYYVIDRVEIAGNDKFSPEPIYFSDKLTCIIGGKSTGKSLLLHNMAMAIDEKQVEKKQETATTNVRQIPELKVYWRDGVCSDDRGKGRKIVYIPQTYLNRLSDEEQETTEIELVIVANQDGKNAPNKQYRFEYRGGSIENNFPVYDNGEIVPGILNCKGIQEHICEILEGGEQAFALRQHKYRFIKS